MNARRVLIGVALVVVLGISSRGMAELSVNIGVSLPGPAPVAVAPPPPVYEIPAPPEVVPVPGTYVYYAPGLSVDILFYHGAWYRPFGGRWYRARFYNGPWVFLPPPRVPQELVMLPPNYRHTWYGHARVPYGELKRNWARWERERYWEGRPEWRDRDRGRHEDWDREHRRDRD